MKIRRSPQEDKILSYAKDRRNAYGENDKSSRKAIPFRKRWVNSSYRSHVNDVLAKPTTDPDELADAVDAVQRHPWRKWADEPLGDAVGRKVRRRHDGTEPVQSRLRNAAKRRSSGR